MGAAEQALLGEEAHDFLKRARTAHLATADGAGRPHVVPVCFALSEETVYIAIDRKPKSGRLLKRLRNIAENPNVALVADLYDDSDWERLRWVMVRGRAELLRSDTEHARALALLRSKYPQYRTMDLAGLPVIAIRVRRATSWSAGGAPALVP